MIEAAMNSLDAANLVVLWQAVTKEVKLWNLLQCKPREEFRANENLENQGFTTFLPEIKSIKNREY